MKMNIFLMSTITNIYMNINSYLLYIASASMDTINKTATIPKEGTEILIPILVGGCFALGILI